MRKHFYSEVGGKNAEQFVEIEEREMQKFLTKLLNDPKDFMVHVRWYVFPFIFYMLECKRLM